MHRRSSSNEHGPHSAQRFEDGDRASRIHGSADSHSSLRVRFSLPQNLFLLCTYETCSWDFNLPHDGQACHLSAKCWLSNSLHAVIRQTEIEQLKLKNRQLTTHLRRSVTSAQSVIHNPMKEQQELQNLRHANAQVGTLAVVLLLLFLAVCCCCCCVVCCVCCVCCCCCVCLMCLCSLVVVVVSVFLFRFLGLILTLALPPQLHKRIQHQQSEIYRLKSSVVDLED